MIFNELGCEDLSRASLVGRSFYALANDNQLWHGRGGEIGLPESKLKNDAHITVKQELKKINHQASAFGIVRRSLNTPSEINYVKLQIEYKSLQIEYESLQNRKDLYNIPPPCIQGLLKGPATPENLDKLKRWLQARSTVILHEDLDMQVRCYTGNARDTSTKELLLGTQWEGIFNVYRKWAQDNQNAIENLKELWIFDYIPLLPEGFFDNSFSKLQKLEFACNGLKELPERALDNLKNLIVLNLSGSQIRKLHEETFSNLDTLGWLFLHNNQLKSLPPDIFRNLSQLTKLGIDGNQLENLPPRVLHYLKNLLCLSLKNNNLTGLPKGFLDDLGSLKYLNLSGNKLEWLPKKALDKLEKLEHLDLSGNKLETLPKGFLDDLGSLKYLNLSGNQLKRLPKKSLDKLGDLEYLDLSENQLETLPEEFFHHLMKLRDLDIRGNKINNNHPSLKIFRQLRE